MRDDRAVPEHHAWDRGSDAEELELAAIGGSREATRTEAVDETADAR